MTFTCPSKIYLKYYTDIFCERSGLCGECHAQDDRPQTAASKSSLTDCLFIALSFLFVGKMLVVWRILPTPLGNCFHNVVFQSSSVLFFSLPPLTHFCLPVGIAWSQPIFWCSSTVHSCMRGVHHCGTVWWTVPYEQTRLPLILTDPKRSSVCASFCSECSIVNLMNLNNIYNNIYNSNNIYNIKVQNYEMIVCFVPFRLY